MTYWVIDRKQFKQGSAIYIVRYHLYLLAEGSKKVVNHVNRPTTGRFVMFHLFLPLAEMVRRTVKEKTALKTGQNVIGDDLHPLAEWWKVVAKDFWVLAEGLGKVVNDFLGTRRVVGHHGKRFSSHCFEVFLVGETRGCVPSLAGFVPCGKQPRLRSRVLYISFFSFYTIRFIMKIFLNIGVSSENMQAALKEICDHFQGKRTDDYMDTLVQGVEKANQALFEVLYANSAKRCVQQEARRLNEHIAATQSYIDSFRHNADEEVKASSKVLKRQFASYGKPLVQMRLLARLTAVGAMLRDLSKPELKAHVDRLPGLDDHIKDIGEAFDALSAKKLEVDEANSAAQDARFLLPLKREAVAQLSRLLSYLEVMAEKEPETYVTHYVFVSKVVSDLNGSYRRKATKSVEAKTDQGDPSEMPDQGESPTKFAKIEPTVALVTDEPAATPAVSATA